MPDHGFLLRHGVRGSARFGGATVSVKAMTWAFEQPLSGNEKVVLLALADFADDDGTCWPSIDRIAEKAYISRSTVIRILKSLADEDYIFSMARTDDNGRQKANRYGLKMQQDEGVNLTPRSVTVDMGEGVNCDTPLKGTITKNHQDICRKAPKAHSYTPAFENFWKAYPVDPGMSKKEAFAAWGKMSDEDQQSASQAIPGFKAWVAKQGKDYRTVHACRYLSQRRFDGFKTAPKPFKADRPFVAAVPASDVLGAPQQKDVAA